MLCFCVYCQFIYLFVYFLFFIFYLFISLYYVAEVSEKLPVSILGSSKTSLSFVYLQIFKKTTALVR